MSIVDRSVRALVACASAVTVAATAVVVASEAPARATGTMDTAAILAAPRPTCDIVLTPATIPSSQDIAVSGQITGLLDWVTPLLDPATVTVWGLGGENDLTTVSFALAAHPVLSAAPIGSGVVVDGAAALGTQKDRLFGAAAADFASSVSSMNMLGIVSSGGTNPGPGDFILTSLNNLTTTTFTYLATTIDGAITTWGLTDPYPLALDVLISLTVTDGTTTRGIILPCTPPPVVASAPVTPPPAVRCDATTLRAGGTAGCTVTGAPADFDFLWRAAINPTIGEGVLTTGADGTGTLTVPLPADSAGSTLTVELVDWTGPVAVGVIGDGVAGLGTGGGPVPSGVPAGGGTVVGVARASGATGITGIAGVLALVIVAQGRRTRRGHPLTIVPRRRRGCSAA